MMQMSELTGQRQRQRAGQACQRCHAKKIKCDLTEPSKSVRVQCQNCVTADAVCQLRPSNRGKRRRPARPENVLTNPESQAHTLINERIEAAKVLANGFDETPLEDGHVSDDANLVLAPYSMTHDMEDPNSYEVRTSNGRTPSGSQVSSNVTAPAMLESNSAARTAQINVESCNGSSLTPQDFQSYLGDSGCMQMFSSDNAEMTTAATLIMDSHHILDDIPPGLMQSYMETYDNNIHTWCPILNGQADEAYARISSSPMLRHAVALCGAFLRPPLLAHGSCSDHYRRAKGLFYANHQDNPIAQICAIMLFHWYSLDQPNLVSMDSHWWWINTSIRLAQQIGLHQEPAPGQVTRLGETPGLRRRIWWTLFVRDRIAALAHGRPLIIDSDACNLQMITADDFPDPTARGTIIFIHWVRLWEIAGQITKELSRKRGSQCKASLARELIDWVNSLPSCLQLPLGDWSLLRFEQDVYALHMAYLTVVIILHFSKGHESTPRASIPAIAAASCIAQIFKVYLSRGSVRYLGPDPCWFSAVAILALLHAKGIEGLTVDAQNDMNVLRISLRELAVWSKTAKMFYTGIERLIKAGSATPPRSPDQLVDDGGMHYFSLLDGPDDLAPNESSGWMNYFPYVTSDTSTLIGTLVVKDCIAMPFPDLEWPDDIILDLQSILQV